MKNSIDDLRNHLFAALEALADEENPMDIERAKAISDVAQTVINSAKVEVELIKATGGDPASDLLRARKVLPAADPLRAIQGKRDQR